MKSWRNSFRDGYPNAESGRLGKSPYAHPIFKAYKIPFSPFSMILLVVSLVSFLLATALRSTSNADPFKQALSPWLPYFLLNVQNYFYN
jgi:hypothetical protein